MAINFSLEFCEIRKWKSAILSMLTLPLLTRDSIGYGSLPVRHASLHDNGTASTMTWRFVRTLAIRVCIGSTEKVSGKLMGFVKCIFCIIII